MKSLSPVLPLCLLFFFSPFGVWGQSGFHIENVNGIYDNQIKTVGLHLDQVFLSQPIIDLNTSTQLLLSFDDMNENEMRYFYTVYHCDANWKTSDLAPLEYLKGFEEGEIRNIRYSGNTQRPYIHYRLGLPNSEVDWSISGNYMLVVYYYDGSEKVPVISRRFMVADNKYNISATFRRPSETRLIQTHHELEVDVDIVRHQLRIPQDQIRLYVYQNGRWDRGITDLRFNRFLGSHYFFDLPYKIVFPSSKEFRHLDNRFINSPSADFAHFERTETGYLGLLYPDLPRLYSPHITYFDINGQFVIMNREANLVNRTIVNYETVDSGDSTLNSSNVEYKSVDTDTLCLSCEYVDVLFTLDVDQPYKDDVYVFGGLTGWVLDPLFKMEYDPGRSAYFAKVQLKQGYYDYVYALDTKDGIDSQAIEGANFEGENDYLFLVYDRHPFNRGDRLVGVAIFNSNE